MNEQPMSEQESLQLITEMIGKAKKSFHETGTSAILWGSVIAVCGLVTYAQMQWDFSVGFDIWILTLVAILPQLVITIRESRRRIVRTHTQEALNATWLVYGLSIFALIFYINVVPAQSARMLAEQGIELFQKGRDGVMAPYRQSVPSVGSLLLLLYGIPTLTTGLAHKFRPMIYGAVCCYLLFVISCFTAIKYDFLFNGLAGIANWLIPGLILRARYLRENRTAHV